jgi:hypothetical protein
LRRFPDSSKLLALKSLALHYFGRDGEAAALALQVARSQSVCPDPLTVSIIGRVLEAKEDAVGVLKSIFEKALQLYFDERIAERLFLLLLRLRHPQKLYQV